MRQYLLSTALFAVAALILYSGVDASLPTVVDYRSGATFAPPEVTITHARITGYCACRRCCGRWSDGITASGSRATSGRTLAGDTAVFAMGTCLTLPGLGPRIVEDTGSAIKGVRLDVYFDSHEEALQWGVQWLPIERC